MVTDHRVLVPVAPSKTIAETIAYAVDIVAERGGTIHLVRTTPYRHVNEQKSSDWSLLEQAEQWVREADDDVAITSELLATEQYLADPADHLMALEAYASDHGIDRTILDPDYAVDATAADLHGLESLLADSSLRYERAPVSADGWLPVREEAVRAGAVFVLAFGFYLVVSEYGATFTLITGAGTAALAAAVLRNVTFETTPAPVAAVSVLGRGLLYLPYLLWDIGKANARFAFIVLHPALPIDPRIDRINAALGNGLAVMAFATSLTLAPGTLAIDARRNELLVHSLTPHTREALLEGETERAIRFVFYGREATDLPGPEPRGDTELVVGPEIESGSIEGERRTGGGEDDE